MTCGIYAIKNLTNNKQYVGSALNIERRWATHRSSLRHGKHPNQKLQRAYEKYGEENFSYTVLETVEDFKLLTVREQWWMDNTSCEYNIRENAANNIGWTPSATTLSRRGESMRIAWNDPKKRINLMRAVHAGAAAVRNKPLSAEHRQKVSEKTAEALNRPDTHANLVRAMTGKKKSESHKKALGVAAKKRWESEDYREKFRDARKEKKEYARPEDVRQRISQAKMGTQRPDLAARNNDPEYQAKVKAGREAYWERKRAEKLAQQKQEEA